MTCERCGEADATWLWDTETTDVPLLGLCTGCLFAEVDDGQAQPVP